MNEIILRHLAESLIYLNAKQSKASEAHIMTAIAMFVESYPEADWQTFPESVVSVIVDAIDHYNQFKGD